LFRAKKKKRPSCFTERKSSWASNFDSPPCKPSVVSHCVQQEWNIRSMGSIPWHDIANLFMVHSTTLSRLRSGHPTNRGSIADSGNKGDFLPSAILTLDNTLPDRKLYRGAASPVPCTGQPLKHAARGTEANHEEPPSG